MTWWAKENIWDWNWGTNCKRLNKLIQKGNLKHFRLWSIIRRTMIVINPFILIPEIFELIGNVHQKYHLLQLIRNTNIDFQELESVVEIGGGYGAMCISVYDKEFNGKYVLYDLPELLTLQKYHIQKRNLNKEIIYTSNNNDINTNGKCSLLIALWSLSEMPLEVRYRITSKILEFDYYMFAFLGFFDGVDNLKYFDNLTKQIGGEWKLIKIHHSGENYYLIKS